MTTQPDLNKQMADLVAKYKDGEIGMDSYEYECSLLVEAYVAADKATPSAPTEVGEVSRQMAIAAIEARNEYLQTHPGEAFPAMRVAIKAALQASLRQGGG